MANRGATLFFFSSKKAVLYFYQKNGRGWLPSLPIYTVTCSISMSYFLTLMGSSPAGFFGTMS